MAKVYLEDSTLTAIGSAIRDKAGTSGLLLPSEMPSAISAIETGGGGSSEITCECDSNGIIGQLACASTSTPVDDDYEFSNSDINFKSVLSKQGPFIILYDR